MRRPPSASSLQTHTTGQTGSSYNNSPLDGKSLGPSLEIRSLLGSQEFVTPTEEGCLEFACLGGCAERHT